uniref:STARD3 N-terminal like n=1 Tax=Nothobranchius furzeri TaxID=105023 RepID=A0A8C6PMA7_NOTFU
MVEQWPAMDSRCSSFDSRFTSQEVGSVISTPVSGRVESYEVAGKKCISDVRRTFCLFVTFDLLFITLLWIIELNVSLALVQTQLEKEVLHYDFHASFFDIFLLAVFRFAALILAYAICKLRHWWAIALLAQGAFGYLLPIISFVLAWIETWLLDFKVLPQEAADENRYKSFVDATEHPPLIGPGPVSEGQFYSPPESLAGLSSLKSKRSLTTSHKLYYYYICVAGHARATFTYSRGCMT